MAYLARYLPRTLCGALLILCALALGFPFVLQAQSDRPTLDWSWPASSIQGHLSRILSSQVKDARIQSIDPISFSAMDGSIRVSAMVLLPPGLSLFDTGASASGGAPVKVNMSFIPRIVWEGSENYLAIQFNWFTLDDHDLLVLFPLVGNVVDAILADERLKRFVLANVATPAAPSTPGVQNVELDTILDEQMLKVDVEKREIRVKLDFKQFIDVEKLPGFDSSDHTFIEKLRIWKFGPSIIVTAGVAETQFQLVLGKGPPTPEYTQWTSSREKTDGALVAKENRETAAKLRSPQTLIAQRDRIVAEETRKLRGGPLSALEQRELDALEATLAQTIEQGLSLDNPRFTGHPERQVIDLRTSIRAQIEGLFNQIERDRRQAASIRREAESLSREVFSPLVEARISQNVMNALLRATGSIEFNGQRPLKSLNVLFLPERQELKVTGLINVSGSLSGAAMQGQSAALAAAAAKSLGAYASFEVGAKLVFASSGTVRFGLRDFTIQLDGKPFTLRSTSNLGHALAEPVEHVLAQSLSSALVGAMGPARAAPGSSALISKQGDDLQIRLDVEKSPFMRFIPKEALDIKPWWLGSHYSTSVGRNFLELSVGQGGIPRPFWDLQDDQLRKEQQNIDAVARAENVQCASNVKALETQEKRKLTPDEIDDLCRKKYDGNPVDMQLRVSIPAMKRKFVSSLKEQLRATLPTDRLARIEPATFDLDFDFIKDDGRGRVKSLQESVDRSIRPDQFPEFDALELKISGDLKFKYGLNFLWAGPATATVRARLKLTDASEFASRMKIANPAFLGTQVLEIIPDFKDSHLNLEKHPNWEGLVNWALRRNIVKNLFMDSIATYLDDPKAPGNTILGTMRLNEYVRFYTASDRIALQIHPRMFSPQVDIQLARSNSLFFENPQTKAKTVPVGLRIEPGQVALDLTVHPTLTPQDAAELDAIARDGEALLAPIVNAKSAAEAVRQLQAARLETTLFRSLSGGPGSLVARMQELTRAYPQLSRSGANQGLTEPSGLGTGYESLLYAKTLARIQIATIRALAKIEELGAQAQLASNKDYQSLVKRRSDVEVERIAPLLQTYREHFQARNAQIAAAPLSDWTRAVRTEALAAAALYAELLKSSSISWIQLDR